MMKTPCLSLVLLFSVTVLSLSRGNSFSQESISPPAEQYITSVVAVIAMDRENRPMQAGSGFFVDRQGVIATSRHVLEGASRAVVRLSDRQEGEVLEILSDDPDCDLLTARTTLQNTSPIALGETGRIEVKEEVQILGRTSWGERMVSEGHILGFRKAGRMELLQISAPLTAGYSGAPVLNKKGEVVGVAAAFADPSKELNFAVPIRYLKTLKPSRLSWASLREKSVRFYAYVTETGVAEILVARDQKRESEGVAVPSRARAASRPVTVYFKNGREVVCDAAWKEGGTVFLVLQGKGYAVGYKEEEIDTKKSFAP